MVKHRPTQTRKSWGPQSRVAGAEPVEARPVAARQMQAVTANVGAHLKPLTRSPGKEARFLSYINPSQPALSCSHPQTLNLKLFVSSWTLFHHILTFQCYIILVVLLRISQDCGSCSHTLRLRRTDEPGRARQRQLSSCGIRGQLTQRIVLNKMFSGCFCLSYTIVLCGIIFELNAFQCCVLREKYWERKKIN